MDFALTEEQQLIIKTTRDFVRAELYRTSGGRGDRRAAPGAAAASCKHKAIAAGLYAANMPTEVGGAGSIR